MTFNLQELANDMVIVTETGKAKHKALLYGQQWAHIKSRMAFKDATAEYDKSVAEFYKPLTEASEALQAAAAGPSVDPLFTVVITEGAEGTPARHAESIHLDEHSAILRLIEQDPNTDRLVWVNESTLAITKE